MFETLLKLAGDNEGMVSEINKIKGNYDSLSSEVGVIEGKLTDAISKRDKYKNVAKEFKSKLGFKEGEELNGESIDAKISGFIGDKDKSWEDKESVFKSEIGTLEAALNSQKSEFQQQLAKKDNDILDFRLNSDLSNVAAGVNAFDGEANKMIVERLKQGATYEDGKLVFKDETGATVRDNGVAMSIEGKLSQMKETLPFLFKAEVNSGSGTQTGGSQGSGEFEGMSENSIRKIREAQAAGEKF